MQIAEALGLLRARQGLTQTAATRRAGVPDYRTLSHWEKDRKHRRAPRRRACSSTSWPSPSDLAACPRFDQAGAYRILGHAPRLELLYGYLKGLGLDFCDLQRRRISSLQLEILAQPHLPSTRPGHFVQAEPGRMHGHAPWIALNEVEAPSPTGCRAGLERLERRVAALERQLGVEAE